MTLKLNHKNYYTKKNTAISNSKISDFLKSKEYYKAKHIDGTIPKKITPNMQLGSMVDMALSKDSIRGMRYKYKVKTLKKNNAALYEKQKDSDPEYIVSQDLMDRAVVMANKMLKSPLYQWYRDNGSMFQVILQDTYDGTPVCGVADAVTITDTHVYLDDWKTSDPRAIKSNKSWYWKCIDFGYLRQMAHYREMLKKQFADKEFVCRHVVIGSTSDSMHPVKVFELPQQLLDSYIHEFKSILYLINEEQEWKDPLPSWEDTEVLELPYEITPLEYVEDFDDESGDAQV